MQNLKKTRILGVFKAGKILNKTMYKEPEITNTQYPVLTDYHTYRKNQSYVKGGSHSGFDHKKGSRSDLTDIFSELCSIPCSYSFHCWQNRPKKTILYYEFQIVR